MSTDLQTVFPQQLANVRDVREAIDAATRRRTLAVVGDDFRGAAQVMVNSVESPEFQVQNKNLLVAVVPEILGSDPIQTVAVLTATLTLNSSSLLRLTTGVQPRKVRGMLKLMQLFLRVLFTTPGRDIFNPDLGGDALKGLGHTFGRNVGTPIVSDLHLAVDRTASQILAIQARDNKSARNERLLAARITSAYFDDQSLSLYAGIELTNQANTIGVANLEL